MPRKRRNPTKRPHPAVLSDLELIESGVADRLLAETGVDPLDKRHPLGGKADGGSGRDELNETGVLDLRSTSESMSDWIRGQVKKGEEMRKKIKRLPGSIPDARLIPDDPHQGSFEDRNLRGG